MEQVFDLRKKTIPSKSVWIAIPLVLLVWVAYLNWGDPSKGGDLSAVTPQLLAIGILPLALSNRPLLIFLWLFSLESSQTCVPSISAFFSRMSWYFLGVSIVVAFIHPRAQRSLPALWKEGRWLWIFSLIAIASSLYSIAPAITFLRAGLLCAIFFIILGLVKPFAVEYGVEKILDLILFAVFPIYLASLFTLGANWAYQSSYNPDYQELARQKVFQNMTGVPQVANPVRRFHGFFPNPNGIGLLGGLVFPLALARLLQNKKKLFYFFLMAALLVDLIFSGSREGFLLCVISGAYVLNRMYGAKTILRQILFLGIPIMLALSPVFLAVFHSQWIQNYLRLGTNVMFGGGRLEAWFAAFQIIKSRILIGYGFGTEDLLFVRFGYRFLFHSGGYAHNAYIGTAMQLGLIGALVLFMPLFLLFFSELSAGKPAPTRLALQGVLLSGLVGCITESWITSFGNTQALPFWMCVVSLQCLRMREKKMEGERV